MTESTDRMVVDASVVLKWVLPEPNREYAMQLLDAYEAGAADLLAPRVLMEEVGSALSKRCRRKDLTPEQTRAAWGFVDVRRPRLIGGDDQLASALSLSVSHHLSFWDSLYLALAIGQRCELITADRRFYAAARPHYPFFRLLGAG